MAPRADFCAWVDAANATGLALVLPMLASAAKSNAQASNSTTIVATGSLCDETARWSLVPGELTH